MAEPTGRTALVTGASAGLGRDFARLFAADGHDVVLVARRADKLEELARELEERSAVRALPLAADLTRREAPGQIHAQIVERGIEIDFLVNNAGFGSNGAFAELDLEREIDMVAVNISALVDLTGRFLPAMLARGRGRILNVGSTAGFQAGPFMATYYASKAFVNLFSEALHHEVAGSGVTVTVSCPGATATEFAMVAGNDRTNLFRGGPVAASEEVAREAYQAMMKGKRMVVHGVRNRFLLQTQRIAPRAAIHRVVSRLNRPAASEGRDA